MLAPLAPIVVDEPLHIAEAPTDVLIVGKGFTVIVRVAVLVQPLALVPVTVYVVVMVGVAVTVVAVVELRPVAGVQVYDTPPLAPIVVDAPIHIAAEPTVVAMVGSAFTVIVRVAVAVQPTAFVPVTVYTVVTVGVAVTLAPVDALSPVVGNQE